MHTLKVLADWYLVRFFYIKTKKQIKQENIQQKTIKKQEIFFLRNNEKIYKNNNQRNKQKIHEAIKKYQYFKSIPKN